MASQAVSFYSEGTRLSGDLFQPDSLERGEAIIFATRWRPVRGVRGHYRVNVRHGVSRVKAGRRFSLGIILHDAK